MIRLILGLGNPGGEYANTRHNTGRDAAMYFAEKHDFGEFEADKKSNSLLSRGKVGKSKILVGLPETFMNKSGNAVGYLSKARGVSSERIIIVQDDLDLPLGTLKLSFARGSGGHKGIESIERALKTNEYLRIRIGESASTPKGKIRKPSGDEKVVAHVIGEFKKTEELVLKKVLKCAVEAIEMVLTDGRPAAMNQFN